MLNQRDWTALSAYLDGQLSLREKKRLERRLEGNPALKAGLEELRRTREVLRQQPRLRAPRHFTLTPEMAGMKLPHRAYPAVRLAAVLASVLFVVVFLGDVLLIRGTSSVPQTASAPVAELEMEASSISMADEGPASELPAEEAEPSWDEGSAPSAQALEEVDTSEAGVIGVGEEEDIVSQARQSPAIEKSVSPGFEQEEEAFEEPSLMIAPTSAPYAGLSPTDLPPPVPTQTTSKTDQVREVPVQPTATAVGGSELPPAELEEFAEPEATLDDQQTGELIPFQIQTDAIRTLELLLAILAIGAGTAALILRRR
jgi:anti-sigma factor RsiW